jgi:hypothetical protein
MSHLEDAATLIRVSSDFRSLVKVRCGVPSCRQLLGRVIALDSGRVGIMISADAADGAQWLVDAGRCIRSDTAFVVPDEGVVPIAPCLRHTQWSDDSKRMMRASGKNISQLAERMGTTVTVMRTAYIDATMLNEAVRHATRSGREGTLLVTPVRYTNA